MKEIYLDSASTSKPIDSILEIMKFHLENDWYNPSSLYSAGVKVKEKIELVRESIAELINANSDEIYFTSGASESNNWVIRGFAEANIFNDAAIITTPIEHKSILNALNNPALHCDIHCCRVDSHGFVDMKSLKYLLELTKGKKVLVSIIAANNEIGTMQSLYQISELVHKYDTILHTDATQALKYIPFNVKEIRIDLLSSSAQKLGGLKGTGFLYKKEGIKLNPLIYGEQENQMRGGTENTLGILALGEAIKHTLNYFTNEKLFELRDYFIDKLEKEFGCKLNGDLLSRLPNNINVTFPQNITGEALVYLLDTAGIRISSGSACNSHSNEPSYVLKAIGLTDEEASRTVRFTLTEDLTKEDIDKVIYEIDKAIKILTM